MAQSAAAAASAEGQQAQQQENKVALNCQQQQHLLLQQQQQQQQQQKQQQKQEQQATAGVVEDVTAKLESVRESFRSSGRCAPQGNVPVFEVDEKNVYDFEQGDLALVWKDLLEIHPLFPLEWSHFFRKLKLVHRIDVAFRIRRELINFKKVLFHAHNHAMDLERRMRQRCTILHTPLSAKHSARQSDYVVMSESLQFLRGLRTGIREARNITKRICQVHRHPDVTAADIRENKKTHVFCAAPDQEFHDRSAVLKKVQQARRVCGAVDVSADLSTASASEGASTAPGAATRWEELDRNLCQLPSLEPRKTLSTTVRQILIGRGAAKAFRMWSNLEAYSHFVQRNMQSIEALLPQLVAEKSDAGCPAHNTERPQPVSMPAKRPHSATTLPTNSEGELTHGSVLSARMSVMLRGCQEALRSVFFGCHSILSILGDEDLGPVFQCGDIDPTDNGTLLVPPRFVVFAMLEELEKSYLSCEHSEMEVLQATGWPPRQVRMLSSASNAQSSASLADVVSGSQRCSGPCNGFYNALWIRDGKCYYCEKTSRSAGVCPFQSSPLCKKWYRDHNGGKPGFRGLDNWLWCNKCCKCVVCEPDAGCLHTRLLRMDGEEVLSLAKAIDAKSGSRLGLVCVDFDQTLCSTKCGGVPVLGNHSVDASLLALYRWCQSQTRMQRQDETGGNGIPFCVVTRNSNTSAIRAFLKAHGVEAEIFCVKAGHSSGGHPVQANSHTPFAGGAATTTSATASSSMAQAKQGHSAQKQSKAKVVLQLAAERACGGETLMVDDTLAEVAGDEQLCNDRHIIRVLFSRHKK